MVDATAQRVGFEQATDGARQDEALTRTQAGSVSFTELVRAHYDWERAGCKDGPEAERFRAVLTRFQAEEGELKHVYWATKRPSAVALTVKQHAGLRGRLTDQDAKIRLHRATDWLAREKKIADLMHHCDTLAIRVSEVLKGTSERIAMQWIYAVESHLLGYVERTSGGRADKAAIKKELNEVWDSQTDELIEIERYYTRAATKEARIVYARGMLIGTLASALVGLLLAALVWQSGWFDEPDTTGAQTFMVCFSAGAVGALVSVLMRMSSNQFRVDYEVGRATIWKLGSFRPFIGAIFGVMLYFVVKSGLLNIKLPDSESETFFFLGSLAFLAGFNERFTNVIFGKAEQTIAASLGDSSAKRRRRREGEDDED